jgi:hypothetical protein
MGSNPINLAIRFLLELTALIVIGIWGWNQSEGWLQYILAFGLPIIMATIWGTFAVPNDPSRSGNAPIVVPGIIRLVVELAFFSIATWVLYDLGYIRLSWVFGIIVVIHYLVSYDRIIWLFKH